MSGPRQVGKTALALKLAGATTPQHSAYLSWDDAALVQASAAVRVPLASLEWFLTGFTSTRGGGGW
jgi:predicted AAA+ superfamily ATPase